MTEIEIREKIMTLQSELESVIANGETEQRELTEEENTQMVNLRTQIEEARAELSKIEEENRKLAEQTNHNNVNNNKTKMKEIRLFDLVKAVAEGNVSEEQRAYIKGNSIDFRAAIQRVRVKRMFLPIRLPLRLLLGTTLSLTNSVSLGSQMP